MGSTPAERNLTHFGVKYVVLEVSLIDPVDPSKHLQSMSAAISVFVVYGKGFPLGKDWPWNWNMR